MIMSSLQKWNNQDNKSLHHHHNNHHHHKRQLQDILPIESSNYYPLYSIKKKLIKLRPNIFMFILSMISTIVSNPNVATAFSFASSSHRGLVCPINRIMGTRSSMASSTFTHISTNIKSSTSLSLSNTNTYHDSKKALLNHNVSPFTFRQGQTFHSTSNNKFTNSLCRPTKNHRSSLFECHATHSNEQENTSTTTATTTTSTTTDNANHNEEEIAYTKTIESTFNIPGLKKETERLILRCHKKIVKANTRYNNARQTMDELLAKDDATMEELDACPNVDALKIDVENLQARMRKLRAIEEGFDSLNIPKKGTHELPMDFASMVIELEINDFPPPRKPSFRKRNKSSQDNNSGPRLPYRRYYSADKTEIRVGKKAEDNDELSCNPEYRDGADWWMHASGCPGSHVVIRCHDQNLDNEVVMDAAALAARQSKCGGAHIKVNLARCRDVKKPRGAKPGLVQLTGNVRTVSVDMKKAQTRLARLDDTLLVN